MSTLAANNITDAAGTGGPTLANGLTIGTSLLAAPSGSAPSYTCRAWVNFNGTTNVGGNCTIRASGNVTSVADNGTGNYTVNFTTAMPDANYAASLGGWNNGTGNGGWFSTGSGSGSYPTGIATTSLNIVSYNSGGSVQDNDAIYIAIFR